jgi:hypothetical protein
MVEIGANDLDEKVVDDGVDDGDQKGKPPLKKPRRRAAT